MVNNLKFLVSNNTKIAKILTGLIRLSLEALTFNNFEY